jgi:hypothetical protein
MATRVTPYLGGTGQDNTRKLNVHSSLNRVSIGADVLASANLDVFGNTFVRGNVETANTFVSTSNSNTPLQAFVGETAGGRWLNKGGSSAFAWYSDTVVTPVTGFSSITYYGTTFYPKIVFGSLGDVSVSGKFATNLAQINRDGTASFGSLSVPALNTVGITGNVYISGNLFVAGNSYQIVSNITQAVGNVVTANAYVVTRLLGVTDIPMSNGITFSNANLVISAYANPSIVFSANNNVWVGSNTAIIGRVASVWTYNPYQLVDDGLVVQHNGGRGDIIQTWIDGRTGTTTRPWSLALTTQGDMAWLVGTAANVKPTIQRMMIDQNGNTLFGTGTVNRANVTITGNASISTNLTVSGNVLIGAPSGVGSWPTLSDKLLIIPNAGTSAACLPFSMTTGNQLNGFARIWGWGVNQLSAGGAGGYSLMVSNADNVRPNINVIDFPGAGYDMNINANVTVSGTVKGLFNRANTLNDAAIQAAVTSRGWPAPVFGYIALPEIDPPGNFNYTRAGVTGRINEAGVLEIIPANIIRHGYDISGYYRGIDIRTFGNTNSVRWSNNLSVTHQVTLSSIVGTFQEGEPITCADNSSGIYIFDRATIAGIVKGTGNFLAGNTLTGSNSGATASITLTTNNWIVEANMIATANQVGVDGIYGSGTLLEATGNNAIIRQTYGGGTQALAQHMYIKRVSGVGAVKMSWKPSTPWMALLDERNQEIFTIPNDRYIHARANGINTNTTAPAILLENANDKVTVGFFATDRTTSSGLSYPNGIDVSNVSGGTGNGADMLSFNIPGLIPAGGDFTFYIKGQTVPQAGAYLASFSSGQAANAVNLQLTSNKFNLVIRNNSAAKVVAFDSTTRTIADPQDFTVVCRVSPMANNSVIVGNDRLYASNTIANAIMFPSAITKLYIGLDGAGAAPTVTTAAFMSIKEIMIWPTALDDENLRLIGNGTKEAIPRPFIENAGQMRSVIQTLTKLKLGGTGNVSIECASDNYGTGTSGTASWPLYLAKYLDTTYSNSAATYGYVPMGSTIGPARSDLTAISFPVGSWTQTLRTKVSPSLGTSATASVGGYAQYIISRALGTGATARVFYLTTADGQAEYSWNGGVTRYPLDFTVGTVGNIGYYDLSNVPTTTGVLHIFRASGTIELAGFDFRNVNSGVVVHKMCNASGLARDWYQVDSTQWKIGYELVNPTASIIMLGCYDQEAPYNESSFAFFLQDMIDRRRATVTNRPIMIVMPPDNRRANLRPMDFYSREARRIAALNNCTFVDLQWIFGNKVSEYDTSWWSDTIVPTATDGGPALVAGILRALESAGT